MLIPLTNNYLFWSLGITYAALTALGCKILYDDFRKLSVKVKWLLAFVVVGFLGVFIGRAMVGAFTPIFLIAIPVYIFLSFLNTKFNNNRFIGQADLDIFNGTLSLLVPLIMYIVSFSYEKTLDSSIHAVQITSILTDLVFWVLVGYLLSLLVAFVRWGWDKIYNKSDEAENIKNIAESEVVQKITVEKDLSGAAVSAVTAALELPEQEHAKIQEAKKQGKTTRHAKKIPICLAFMPVYYVMVYFCMACVL